MHGGCLNRKGKPASSPTKGNVLKGISNNSRSPIKQTGPKPAPPVQRTLASSRLKIDFRPIVEPVTLAGRLRPFLPNWLQITVDPAILDVVQGYKLEFLAPPSQKRIRPPELEKIEVATLLEHVSFRSVRRSSANGRLSRRATSFGCSFAKRRPESSTRFASLQHSWNVDIVLNYLRTPAGNKELSLKLLTHKLAVLLALTAPKRSSELQLLDLRYMCILPEGVELNCQV